MPSFSRESNRFRPNLTALGDRIVPSAVAVSAALAAPHSAAVVHEHHGLAGLAHGTFHKPDGIIADLGTIYKLRGWGVLADLGHVAVDGSVTGVGFVQTGKAAGTLTFSNASGSVTVSVQGPVQPGYAVLPHYYHYQVVGTTGDFSHFRDSGTLRLDFSVDPSAAPGAMPHGSFRLAI